MAHVLEISHLTKQFGHANGGFMAVDHISFHVKEGEIVGLLGPNGAGKTTTIQMLLGLITPTSGSIRYFGKDFLKEPQYCLSQINFASAYTHLQIRMTVKENLSIYAGLYGIKHASSRITELLSLLEVEEVMNKLFWHLSAGQKTRVILAKALLNKPRLILMDEPTASLDPDIANKVVELILKLQDKEGVSILYTSHNMEEVERLCDRVMFLNHGSIVAEDTPLGLTKRIGKARLRLTFDGVNAPIITYLKKHGYTYEFIRDEMVEVEVPDKDIPKVLFGISREGVWITDIEVKKPNLEDVFISVAGGTYEHTKN